MQKILLAVILCCTARFAATQTPRTPPGASQPFVLGVTETLRSGVLREERLLNIYLPTDYNPRDTTRYSVIYLLDGGADEDFIHVAGAVQFLTFPWIAQVPKSIVVGIANTDRRRDFTFPTTMAAQKERFPTTGGSANFMTFLEKELQPYIERTYPTNGSTMLIGQSLGGLLATEILLKKPAMFDKYLIISPSLWWNNGLLLELESEVITERFTKPTDVYIAVGKEGVVAADVPRVMEVDANLLADRLKRGESKALRVHFDYFPEEDHATVGHLAVFKGLKRLFAER